MSHFILAPFFAPFSFSCSCGETPQEASAPPHGQKTATSRLFLCPLRVWLVSSSSHARRPRTHTSCVRTGSTACLTDGGNTDDDDTPHTQRACSPRFATYTLGRRPYPAAVQRYTLREASRPRLLCSTYHSHVEPSAFLTASALKTGLPAPQLYLFKMHIQYTAGDETWKRVRGLITSCAFQSLRHRLPHHSNRPKFSWPHVWRSASFPPYRTVPMHE